MKDFLKKELYSLRAVTAILARWLLLAVPTGLVCGAVGTAFHLAVEHVTEWRGEHVWLLWLLPLAGLAIVALYKLTGCEGMGTNNVIRAVHSGESVSPLLVPAIFLGTVLTHLCGGSAGREGAALQMGGSIGYNIAKLFRFSDHDRRTATACGMAAFFSALFGTPLAATLFGIMVEDVGLAFSVAFVPGFAAALIAYGVSLACGIAPAKTHIFIQSMVPELTELSFYYMNLVTVSRLQRNPTVKSEIHMRNFETSIPVGFFCYPISQAADITAFHATTVPAGEDQKPMIEQCCEIVRKFNAVYGDTLTEPEIVLPQNAACLRLPGTDGKAKMSKSLGNCIYLSEEPEDIKKKVMSMYTDPNHLRVQDPGKVEGNPVFIYLDAFCRPEHFAEFWPEYQNLDEVKEHYQRGGLGDVKVKKFLNSVMQAELEPIRTRRKEWEQRLPEVVEILKEGSAYAEKTAAATLAEVRKSMRIDYFENDNLLK